MSRDNDLSWEEEYGVLNQRNQPNALRVALREVTEKLDATSAALITAESKLDLAQTFAAEMIQQRNAAQSRLSAALNENLMLKSFMREVDRQAAEAHMAKVVERQVHEYEHTCTLTPDVSCAACRYLDRVEKL